MDAKEFDELKAAVTAYVDLLSQEKRAALVQDAPVPKQAWWKRLTLEKTAKFLGVATTVLSLIGAVFLFLYSEIEKTKLRQDEFAQNRREAIATFAIDLSDPKKRVSAAFAVATLGAEEALPLLMHHLNRALLIQETKRQSLSTSMSRAINSPASAELSKFGVPLKQIAGRQVLRDIGFDYAEVEEVFVVAETKDALTEQIAGWTEAERFAAALIEAISKLPNDAGVRELVWLNRNASSPVARVRETTVIKATSAAIWDYAATHHLAEMIPLDGVQIRDINFSYNNIARARLENLDIVQLSACDAVFDTARFAGSKLVRFGFERGSGTDADFSGSFLRDGRFDGLELDGARFDLSRLDVIRFKRGTLTKGSFRQTGLSDVTFDGIDLTGADFTGAAFNLGHSASPDRFAYGGHKSPSFDPSGLGKYWARGAVVRNADFLGVRWLHDLDREYLCKFGALNVPGGCEGIDAAPDEDIPVNDSGFSSSCF